MAEEHTAALPCVVCGCALVNVFPGVRNQPDGATIFTARGHYGSGVFVVLPGDMPHRGADLRLQVNICDRCLAAAGKSQRVYLVANRPVVEYEPSCTFWNAGGEDADAPPL